METIQKSRHRLSNHGWDVSRSMIGWQRRTSWSLKNFDWLLVSFYQFLFLFPRSYLIYIYILFLLITEKQEEFSCKHGISCENHYCQAIIIKEVNMFLGGKYNTMHVRNKPNFSREDDITLDYKIGEYPC